MSGRRQASEQPNFGIVADAIEEISEDKTYFKLRDVEELVDLSTAQIRYLVPALEEEGVIERWNSNSPATWRIL